MSERLSTWRMNVLKYTFPQNNLEQILQQTRQALA